MSRAFVRDEGPPDPPPPAYSLPPRDDADFPRAAAAALLDGARISEIASAELATGYRWGDATLVPCILQIHAEAERRGDDRLTQVAERYLRAAGHDLPL
ncbi:MAG TPA: hypothetical protein VGM77_07680 [Gemmatimonadales bacterium]|jgi:hypothetical protein